MKNKETIIQFVHALIKILTKFVSKNYVKLPISAAVPFISIFQISTN